MFYYKFYNFYIDKASCYGYLRYNNNFVFRRNFLNRYILNVKINIFKFISKISFIDIDFIVNKLGFFFLGVFIFKRGLSFKFFAPVDFLIKKFISLGIGVLLRNTMKWSP